MDLPKLKKINYNKKTHRYKLSNSTKKRRLAIDEGIKSKKNTRKAALAKKGRFNILRIYRKYNNYKDCQTLTKDMKYIDKRYKLGYTKDICQKGGDFLYNPNDPKKSFDVYIDKNPEDTIPISYKTPEDVKNTIDKLEHLYKNNKYTHKRIWQVGMIMKVRLEAMKKHHKTLYPKAKHVNERFDLANRYFKFLGKRSKEKIESKRKNMLFQVNL